MHTARPPEAAAHPGDPGSPSPRWWLRGLRAGGPVSSVVALLVLGYGAGTFLVWALGRVAGDATGWLYLTNLSLIYWMAPAVLLTLLAFALRWWGIGMVCGLGAAVWLATFGALFVPDRPLSEPPDTVRMTTYNMGPDIQVAHVRRVVEQVQPDVLLLQEVVPAVQDDLVAALALLPHHHFSEVNRAAPGGGGTAVFARYPLGPVFPVEGLPSRSRPTDFVTVLRAGGPFRVASVHLTSPSDDGLSPDLDDARRTLGLLGELADEADRRRDETAAITSRLPGGPVIVGGDLNASTANDPRRALLDAGLVDLHRVGGAGPGFTARRKHFRFKVDWLFASADVEPILEWTHEAAGSDHLPVVADLVVPGSR